MAKLSAAWRRLFERSRTAARRLTADPESPGSTLATVDRAIEQAHRVGKVRGLVGDITTMGRLVRAWSKRDYRQVSRSTIVMVLGALVYFVSPIDAILDSIPVLGFIDDAAVLAWVISEIRAELDEFRTWETGRALPA